MGGSGWYPGNAPGALVQSLAAGPCNSQPVLTPGGELAEVSEQSHACAVTVTPQRRRGNREPSSSKCRRGHALTRSDAQTLREWLRDESKGPTSGAASIKKARRLLATDRSRCEDSAAAANASPDATKNPARKARCQE